MAENYIDYELLTKLSGGDYTVVLPFKVIKVNEECGELSQAVLAYLGAKNASKSAMNGDLKENVLEECCDVMNVVMDIINNLNYDDDEVRKMFEKKLRKWEKKSNVS